MELEDIYAVFIENPVICHDTRKIIPGCIYWAIKGERFDGNSFAAQAFEKGAAYAILDNPDYVINDHCILVENTLETLQKLATIHRRQLGIHILAIAGSNGKTTTKELIKRVLSEKMTTFATPGNYNNHIGLPLSILQIHKNHKIAVLELGANHQGENAFLCTIAEPDMGIITNIGKDHLEGFGGIDGVEKANMELFDYLKQHNGNAFVNLDDARIRKNVSGLKSVSYSSREENADISGSIESTFPGLTAKISDHNTGNVYEINSHFFGSVNLYNILAAATVGSYFEIDPWQIKNAIEGYVPENNRSQIVSQGTNTIILDAYNANPSSMLPAIYDFAVYPAARKILILGDMFELGEDSAAEHENMLQNIDFTSFYNVALAGKQFYSFIDKYPAQFFEDTLALKNWFENQDFQDTVFYIKGSRGMALETIIKKLED